jgi:glycosyltransferase involved in cell wall biosynthesis
VTEGKTGFICADDAFADAIEALAGDPAAHQAMRQSARQYVLSKSWDAVFEDVYGQYASVLTEKRNGATPLGRAIG